MNIRELFVIDEVDVTLAQMRTCSGDKEGKD